MPDEKQRDEGFGKGWALGAAVASAAMVLGLAAVGLLPGFSWQGLGDVWAWVADNPAAPITLLLVGVACMQWQATKRQAHAADRQAWAAEVAIFYDRREKWWGDFVAWCERVKCVLPVQGLGVPTVSQGGAWGPHADTLSIEARLEYVALARQAESLFGAGSKVVDDLEKMKRDVDRFQTIDSQRKDAENKWKEAGLGDWTRARAKELAKKWVQEYGQQPLRAANEAGWIKGFAGRVPEGIWPVELELASNTGDMEGIVEAFACMAHKGAFEEGWRYEDQGYEKKHNSYIEALERMLCGTWSNKILILANAYFTERDKMGAPYHSTASPSTSAAS